MSHEVSGSSRTRLAQAWQKETGGAEGARMGHGGGLPWWSGALVLVGWSGVCVVGAVAVADFRQRTGTLEGREVRVVDAAGAVRAEMTTGSDGVARMVLRDGHGEERLALRAMAGGEAAVELLDSGRLRVRLEARPGGEAGLWLSDGTQAARMSLAITPKGGADLDLRTPEGAIHLSSTLSGEQLIETLDRGGKSLTERGLKAGGSDEGAEVSAGGGMRGRLVPARPAEL